MPTFDEAMTHANKSWLEYTGELRDELLREVRDRLQSIAESGNWEVGLPDYIAELEERINANK